MTQIFFYQATTPTSQTTMERFFNFGYKVKICELYKSIKHCGLELTRLFILYKSSEYKTVLNWAFLMNRSCSKVRTNEGFRSLPHNSVHVLVSNSKYIIQKNYSCRWRPDAEWSEDPLQKFVTKTNDRIKELSPLLETYQTSFISIRVICR